MNTCADDLTLGGMSLITLTCAIIVALVWWAQGDSDDD